AATRGSRTCSACGCAASPAGSSRARTTCTSSRFSRGSCASSPTGRPRSSSAATSPSSGCSATRSALATSELRRAYEFLTRADMAGEQTEPTRFGVAVSDDRVPKRYDSNYLLVETVPPGATAEELAADARAYGRPMIFFRDERSAEPLLPGFRALGWHVDRHVFMVHRE